MLKGMLAAALVPALAAAGYYLVQDYRATQASAAYRRAVMEQAHTEYQARKQRDGKTEFGRSTSVFAGSLAFNILSISQNEPASGRHLDEFLRAVEIVDGGPRRTASR